MVSTTVIGSGRSDTTFGVEINQAVSPHESLELADITRFSPARDSGAHKRWDVSVGQTGERMPYVKRLTHAAAWIDQKIVHNPRIRPKRASDIDVFRFSYIPEGTCADLQDDPKTGIFTFDALEPDRIGPADIELDGIDCSAGAMAITWST